MQLPSQLQFRVRLAAPATSESSRHVAKKVEIRYNLKTIHRRRKPRVPAGRAARAASDGMLENRQ